jgi:ABC-type glycerol-3-phosphate transport system substrate-binding protein
MFLPTFPLILEDTCIESMSFVKADLIPYLNAKYPEIADSISVELQNVIIGAKSSKEALDESAKQVADLLKK